MTAWSCSVPDYKAAVGRYYAAAARDLGFRTTLRVHGVDDYDVYDPTTRAQTGVAGWGADYLAPSTFLEPNFSCAATPAHDTNLSRLCDRKLQRQIERAHATPPERPAPPGRRPTGASPTWRPRCR